MALQCCPLSSDFQILHFFLMCARVAQSSFFYVFLLFFTLDLKTMLHVAMMPGEVVTQLTSPLAVLP